MDIYFTDYFNVPQETLEEYGAFDISLITDLPLFIDPFLLFASEKEEYQALHDNMIRYLSFLRTKSEGGGVSEGLIEAWYHFAEVKQNWLGFCETGNTGRGLGGKFARALNENLVHVFRNFGNEAITSKSHLEKLCLIDPGVGKDMISDFTTNLIKDYLLRFTEQFAKSHVASDLVRPVPVERAHFNYDVERWMGKTYSLPFYNNDFVILTPIDILTRDDTWISHSDMLDRFERIPRAIDNDQLRAEINNYFRRAIARYKKPTKKDWDKAVSDTLRQYPQLVDYYIKMKEDSGDEAAAASSLKVLESHMLYVKQFGELAGLLQQQTPFYTIPGNTKEETRIRIAYFKDVIENKGGHRLFYISEGPPIRREKDLHLMFRLVWIFTPSDVSREANDGRGPPDFKISRGAADKTLVEFKLAKNPKLKQNLLNQLDVYKRASDAKAGFKVIVYFSDEGLDRVERILRELKMEKDGNIILIDARSDNKPSGSNA